MCFLSGGGCRIYFYVYFFHSDRLLSLQADWLKIHIKVSVSAFVRSRARPSSGLSENQNGFIIFTIQIVIQIRKFANMQIQIHKYKYKYNMIHNHCQNTELWSVWMHWYYCFVLVVGWKNVWGGGGLWLDCLVIYGVQGRASKKWKYTNRSCFGAILKPKGSIKAHKVDKCVLCCCVPFLRSVRGAI